MNSKNCYVLCIEDEEEIRSYLKSVISEISCKTRITFAKSKDEAISLLESGLFFDYITLDLTIPITEGSFEKSSKNGLAVLGTAKELCPGAPVLILTGTSTVRMIGDFLNTSNNVDIWSEGCSRPTVAHLEKADLVELSDHIKTLSYFDFKT